MHENVAVEGARVLPKPLSDVAPIFPRFNKQDIADDRLWSVIEAAHLAPSDWSVQSWRWILVRGEAAKKYLEAAAYIKVPISSAPVIMVCLADTLAWKSAPQHLQEMIAGRKITEQEGRESLRRLREYYSSSPDIAKRTALANAFMALHQVLLGAAESNLLTYWVTEFDEGRIRTYFHIPDHFLVAALLPIGYREAGQAPVSSKLPLRTVIYKEKFGGSLGPPR